MKFILPALLIVCSAQALPGAPTATGGVVVREASGIARVDDKLLVVGDDADGRYFEFLLPEHVGDVIPLDPARVREVPLPGAEMALDLESLALLCDGRVAFLSEQSRCLIAEDSPGSGRYAVIAEYDRTVAEIGGRGLEGLAVKDIGGGGSRIAVLWEGGYLEQADLNTQLRDVISGRPLKPIILVHDLRSGGKAGLVKNPLMRIQLEVPTPEGDPPLAQRFRAVDLVWHKPEMTGGEEQFIVLISSGNSPPENSGQPTRYQFKFLQRFDLSGRPKGRPLDLKDIFRGALGRFGDAESTCIADGMIAHVREVKILLEKGNWENVNWEGLGWYVEGERLMTIYDAAPKDPPLALIFDIPEDWK